MGIKIYNSNLTKEIIDVAKIQTSTDGIPTEIADKVVPVIDVNPKHAKISNLVAGTVGSATANNIIQTVLSDRDTYLTVLTLSYIKDVTSTSTYVALNLILDGTTGLVTILYLPCITLTAGNDSISITLRDPIKLKKGSSVQILTDSATANIKMTGTVVGFYDNNINA